MITCSYAVARDKINDGDIVFVRGSWRHPIQTLIMFFTRSPYSHVGIAFWIEINKTNRLMIVEAQGGTKRRILNMSYYQNRNLDVVESPRSWESYADVATEKLGEVGYGWMDALYIGLRDFLKGVVVLPAKDVDSGEICSEFIAKCLEIDEQSLGPGGLFDYLIEHGSVLKIKIRR